MRPPIMAPWGKLACVDGEVLAWHPLTHHCLDVAAVMSLLLDRTLLRRRLAVLAGLADLTPRQIRRLAWFAYLHDLGKLNAGFQARRPGAGHVKEGLAACNERSKGWRLLRPASLLAWLDGEPEAFWGMISAAIAHHGRPLSHKEAGNAEEHRWGRVPGYDPLAALADFLAAGEAALAPDFDDPADPLPATPAFTHAFAGLVTLADWIASDSDLFPFSEALDEDRLARALRQAARALAAMGIDTAATRAATPACAWLRAIGIADGRPMQRAIEELPLADGPAVVLLESDTGSGKTEAAIAYFLRLLREGFVDGMYFALPTRAAAVQIHSRVEAALRNALGDAAPPVILAVPGYEQLDAAETRPLPDEGSLWPEGAEDRGAARLWAAERPKRFLAAAVAVGTIDQALLAALQVRHAHLRATALTRHLLVVDEVHASDAYMTELLSWVLDRLFQTGGQALLMSATLGSAARRRLLMEEADESAEEAASRPYPLVTVHRDAGRETIACPHHAPERSIAVETLAAMSAARATDLAERAVAAARRGARVLVIRNTVADALVTQAALETATEAEPHLAFRCNGVAAPHHSRFARADRRLLDTAVEYCFGRDADRQGGLVLVATQTVEQSLDIDADLLFTDLCPMDVMLQRLGRLHRHRRPRPAGFGTPQAVVLTPDDRDLTPLVIKGRGAFGIDGRGDFRAYPDLRVIEATWRLIAATPVLRLPAMNRPLVEGATDPRVLHEIAEALGDAWRRHGMLVAGGECARRSVAEAGIVDWRRFYGEQGFPDDLRLATRLGARDRVVAFDPPAPSPFDPAASVAMMTLPHWMARDVPADAVPEILGRAPLTFRLGHETYLYDRLGLRRKNT